MADTEVFCLSGWMPWLSPTPGPESTRKLRGYRNEIIPPEDPEMASQKGETKAMQRPWRKCTRLIRQVKSRREGEGYGYTTYYYELECGHQAIRRLRSEKTTCGVCPREMR